MKEKEEHIEDAVVVEDAIQETVLEATIPAIPEVFFIEDKEYSLAVVADLDKRAKALAKKATPKSFEDKKLWEQIFDLKQEAVKMRTTPENKRKEVSKPVQAFLKELKTKTDRIGEAAQKIQDDLEALLTTKENWEAEKIRLEEERIQKRTDGRIAELFALDTKFDPSNGTYAFEYSPGTVMSKVQIEDFDDEEWAETLKDIEEAKVAHEAEVKALAEKKEQEDKEAKEKLDAAQKEIDDAKEALLTKQLRLRTKELTLSNAGFANGSWVLGGQSFSPEDLRDLTDEEWDAKIELANKPQESKISPDDKKMVMDAIDNLVADVDTPLESLQVPQEKDRLEPMFPPPTTLNGQPYYVTKPENTAPVVDPLGDVIAEKVEAHEAHQNEVDGIITAELTFTPEKPFEEIFLKGTSFVRIFPIDYEDQALDINKDWIQNMSQLGDNDLIYLFYTKPKK